MANTPNDRASNDMAEKNRQTPQQGGRDEQRGQQQQADQHKQGQQGGQRDQAQRPDDQNQKR